MKYYRMQQILLDPHPYAPAVLDRIFADLSGVGCNSILLEYHATFPYQGILSSAVRSNAYTREEINAIVCSAAAYGIEIIPKGFSFTHAKQLVKLEKFQYLADGESLNLALNENIELMLESSRELLLAHPGCRLIHLGGDEMFGFGRTPESCTALMKEGFSSMYVDFVNAIAAGLKSEGVRIAIWSDTLIRYPQALEKLDKSIVMFYWDYWAMGEESAFLSIGGGCPDIFVLDRSGLPRDLNKMFRNPVIRNAGELPLNHFERYHNYWRWSPGQKRARSFPYVEFLREFGLDVVSCFLPYTEKGSILSNYAEKLPHTAVAIRRNYEYDGIGFLCCLWQPYWPDWRAVWPAIATAFICGISQGKVQKYSELFNQAATILGDNWTAEALLSYFNIGNNFEFNDLVDIYWRESSPAERLRYIQRSGWREEELERLSDARTRSEDFLHLFPCAGNGFIRFIVSDLLIRAKAEERLLSQLSCHTIYDEFEYQGRLYREFCADFFHSGENLSLWLERYEPWLKHLSTITMTSA